MLYHPSMNLQWHHLQLNNYNPKLLVQEKEHNQHTHFHQHRKHENPLPDFIYAGYAPST